MSDQTRLVFGISPGISDDDHQHVFLDVLGEVINGRLKPVREPKTEFPNVGNVYLHADQWIPPYGVGAIWPVRSTVAVDSRARRAEYSVVERGRPLPVEIITVSVSPDSPDVLHQTLVEGVPLSHSTATTVLLQLTDGPIIGPVRCDPLPNDDGFSCKSDALNDPLGCWLDSSLLEPITFRTRSDRRTFTSLLNLPEPTAYYDCSDMEHAIRSIVKVSRNTLGTDAELTKKQIDALSRSLAELSVPTKFHSRLGRVRNAFTAGTLGHAELKQFADHLASQPTIQAELTAIRKEAGEKERERIAAEQSTLVKQLTELRNTKARTEAQLKTLLGRIGTAESDFAILVDAIAAKLKDRIDKVRNEPATMLAEVALLRPFLKDGTDTQPIDAPPLQRLTRPSDVVDVHGSGELLACVERNLAATGLLGASAKRLTREVVAAAQANQMIVFSGSLGSILAIACANAFAADTSYEYRVPVGLLDGESVRLAVSRVVKESEVSGILGAIVFEGVNRSALEAYGDELRNLVTAGQLTASWRSGRPVIIGSLARGPSVLSITPAQCELGPILDTDSLTLASRASVVTPQGGRVSQSDWQQLCLDATSSEAEVSEYQELQKVMEGDESILWRQTLKNAYGRLRALNDGTSSSPMQSLAFGWLMPRAHYSQLPPVTFLEELKAATVIDEKNPDPRVRRLLTRYFPSEPRNDERV